MEEYKAVNELMKDLKEGTKKIIHDLAYNYGDVVLLDTSYHIYRYFYAHRHLGVDVGDMFLPTGHVYGVTNLVCSLRDDIVDPSVILVLDGRDEKRYKINPNYKAGRGSKSDFKLGTISKEVVAITSTIEKGVYVSYNPNFEADDTMYSIALTLRKLFKDNNIDKDIYIYTTDKDLYQAVNNDGIYIMKSFKRSVATCERLGYNDVIEEFGVDPDRLVCYRALVGDSSDNLYGYKRIPKKLAVKIVDNCGFFSDHLEITSDVKFTDTEKKWLKLINSEYKIFLDNYLIMKLKLYPFTLSRADNLKEGEDLIERYGLVSFKNKRSFINERRADN